MKYSTTKKKIESSNASPSMKLHVIQPIFKVGLFFNVYSKTNVHSLNFERTDIF